MLKCTRYLDTALTAFILLPPPQPEVHVSIDGNALSVNYCYTSLYSYVMPEVTHIQFYLILYVTVLS